MTPPSATMMKMSMMGTDDAEMGGADNYGDGTNTTEPTEAAVVRRGSVDGSGIGGRGPGDRADGGGRGGIADGGGCRHRGRGGGDAGGGYRDDPGRTFGDRGANDSVGGGGGGVNSVGSSGSSPKTVALVVPKWKRRVNLPVHSSLY
jgi:hypothetical protein